MSKEGAGWNIVPLQPQETPPFKVGDELPLAGVRRFNGVIFEVMHPPVEHLQGPFVARDNRHISYSLAKATTGSYSVTTDGLVPKYHNDAMQVDGVGYIRIAANGAVLATHQYGRMIDDNQQVRVLFIPTTVQNNMS